MDIRIVDEKITRDVVALTEVYVDTIVDLCNTKKLLRELSRFFPLRKLSHLNRIKDQDVILFITDVCDVDKVHETLKEKGVSVEYLKNEVKVTKVPTEPPKFTRQYCEAKIYWPINFNPYQNMENLKTKVFSAKDSYKHGTFMRIVRMLSKKYETPVALVADPKINSIVAVGVQDIYKRPCRHATMVALDNVANTQGEGAWTENCPSRSAIVAQLNVLGIPKEIYRFMLDQIGIKCKFGAVPFQCEDVVLCTEYNAYLSDEPCVMCAMALMHANISNVFYDKFSKNGALGTLCKLHLVEDLKCPFKVFLLNFPEE